MIFFFTPSENNPSAHIMPSVRWSYVFSLPDRSYLDTLPWVQCFFFVFFCREGGFNHTWHPSRRHFLWCDAGIRSLKGQTPRTQLHDFVDWVPFPYCLFPMMPYLDGKNKLEVYLARVMTPWRLPLVHPQRLSGCHIISAPKSLNASQFWQTTKLAWR